MLCILHLASRAFSWSTSGAGTSHNSYVNQWVDSKRLNQTELKYVRPTRNGNTVPLPIYCKLSLTLYKLKFPEQGTTLLEIFVIISK